MDFPEFEHLALMLTARAIDPCEAQSAGLDIDRPLSAVEECRRAERHHAGRLCPERTKAPQTPDPAHGRLGWERRREGDRADGRDGRRVLGVREELEVAPGELPRAYALQQVGGLVHDRAGLSPLLLQRTQPLVAHMCSIGELASARGVTGRSYVRSIRAPRPAWPAGAGRSVSARWGKRAAWVCLRLR